MHACIMRVRVHVQMFKITGNRVMHVHDLIPEFVLVSYPPYGVHSHHVAYLTADHEPVVRREHHGGWGEQGSARVRDDKVSSSRRSTLARRGSGACTRCREAGAATVLHREAARRQGRVRFSSVIPAVMMIFSSGRWL